MTFVFYFCEIEVAKKCEKEGEYTHCWTQHQSLNSARFYWTKKRLGKSERRVEEPEAIFEKRKRQEESLRLGRLYETNDPSSFIRFFRQQLRVGAEEVNVTEAKGDEAKSDDKGWHNISVECCVCG